MSEKAAVWRGHLAAWRASEQSAAAFCRSRGLAYAQFVYWQRKLQDVAAFVPVQVEAPVRSSDWSLELTLPNGVSLRVTGTDAVGVAALVRALSC